MKVGYEDALTLGPALKKGTLLRERGANGDKSPWSLLKVAEPDFWIMRCDNNGAIPDTFGEAQELFRHIDDNLPEGHTLHVED